MRLNLLFVLFLSFFLTLSTSPYTYVEFSSLFLLICLIYFLAVGLSTNLRYAPTGLFFYQLFYSAHFQFIVLRVSRQALNFQNFVRLFLSVRFTAARPTNYKK